MQKVMRGWGDARQDAAQGYLHGNALLGRLCAQTGFDTGIENEVKDAVAPEVVDQMRRLSLAFQEHFFKSRW